MKNISNKIKIISTVIIAVMFAAMPLTGASAWGGANLNITPGDSDKICVRDQVTSTAEQCDEYINPAASYPLFNRFIDRLITSSSTRIDERNFVQICEYSDTSTNGCVDNYVDEMNLVPGKKYQIYIMYHNNAATEVDGSPNLDYSSHNAKVNAIVPDELVANGETNISSTISWDAFGQPSVTSSVWDEAKITSDRTVDLRYISGSAKVHMNSFDTTYEITDVVDQVLAQSLFKQSGTFLGHYDATNQEIVLDGVVYGCTKYSGWITFQFEVEAKPCDLNPDLDADDPGCKPCEFNPELSADDPNCKEVEGIPDTGAFQPIVVSVISIIGFGIITAGTVLYFTKHQSANSKKK